MFTLIKVYDRHISGLAKLRLENTNIRVWLNDVQQFEYRCDSKGNLRQTFTLTIPNNILNANDSYIKFELFQDSHRSRLVRHSSGILPFRDVLKNNVE